MILKYRNNYILLIYFSLDVQLYVYLIVLCGFPGARLYDSPPTAVADHAVAIRGVFWVKERARVLFASIS